jgi:hypothetical protein
MPRPASPELRERIFGTPTDPASAPIGPFRFADLTQWLVPAFGCFLLVIGTLSSRYPSHDVSMTATNMLLSENAAYAGSIDHSEKNALPAAHVEWNFGNRANATSYNSEMPASYTNKIIQ